MKKKIGIITIIGNNYGNRLQNWALQETIKKYGFCVKTIPIYNEPIIKQKIKYTIQSIIPYAKSKNGWEDFYFLINWESKSCRNLNVEKYKYFIAGSDQIWNPHFDYNTDREFLAFANIKQRIAYAASIGINALPEELEKKYKDMLSKIPYISVRENSAADIIYNLCKREVPVVLDPVFLVSKDKWKTLIKKSFLNSKERKPYIFKYFLSKINNDTDKFIKQLAEEKGCEIVDILEYYDVYGPLEFLYLIKNAQFIVTDSFHCTAFSVIFQKEFVTITRNSDSNTGDMSDRLKTLLSKLKIKDRYLNNKNICFSYKTIDWDKVNEILDKEREYATLYIEDAMQLRGKK